MTVAGALSRPHGKKQRPQKHKWENGEERKGKTKKERGKEKRRDE